MLRLKPITRAIIKEEPEQKKPPVVSKPRLPVFIKTFTQNNKEIEHKKLLSDIHRETVTSRRVIVTGVYKNGKKKSVSICELKTNKVLDPDSLIVHVEKELLNHDLMFNHYLITGYYEGKKIVQYRIKRPFNMMVRMVVDAVNEYKTEEITTPKKEIRKTPQKRLQSYTHKKEFKSINVKDNDELKFNVYRTDGTDSLRLDIRQFVTSEKYTGYTKKGINVPMDLLPELIETLQLIEKEYD